MQKRTLTSFFYLSSAILLLVRCANPVSPTGGPKDIQPPAVLDCTPQNYVSHFNSREIRINFDEFIQLNDPTKEIFISPPLLPNIDFRLRGKSLLISLDDTLQANTTYSINFGEAISDITENNVLRDFYYVFSTGDYTDSLSLKGQVVSAFDLKPQKDVLAMLYLNNNDTLPLDSLPLKVKPYYLTRTNENGEFILHNLKNDPMLLFALNDQDGDMIYNISTEKVAFSDTLAKPYFIPGAIDDSIKNDSLNKKDKTSLQVSTTGLSMLRMFEKFDSTQRILKAGLVKNGQVMIVFSLPNQHPLFEPLNFTPADGWMIEEENHSKDTITLWIKDVSTDSLILRIADDEKIIDTVEMELRKPAQKKKTSKAENEAPERLSFSNNTVASKLNQFKSSLEIISSYPLINWQPSGIYLIDAKDTLHPKVEFADSVKRRIRILYPWKEEKSYSIFIPDSVFFSFNNLTNDTIKMNFGTRALKEFGSFLVNINFSGPAKDFIIQLLSEKDAIIEQKVIKEPGKIKFEYLSPRNYKLKAIFDRNKNRRWDTGNYSNKIKPEEVFIFPRLIEIRSNWDVEENWDL